MATDQYDDIIDSLEASQAPASEEPMAADPYDEVIDGMSQEQDQQLKASLHVAAKAEPDRRARVLELSKRAKLPAEVVERNFDDLSQKFSFDVDPAELRRKSPGVARFMENPDNAALVKDEVTKAQELEEKVQDHGLMSTMYRALQSGLARMGASSARVPGFMEDLSGAMVPKSDVTGRYPELNRDLKKFDEEVSRRHMYNPISTSLDKRADEFKVPEMDQSITEEIGRKNYARAGRILAVQFVANAPNQAAIIAGSLLNPALGVGFAAATTAAETQKRSLEAGATREQALTNAVIHGTAEAGFEYVGTFGILKSWAKAMERQHGKAVTRQVIGEFSKQFAYSMIAEGNEEAVTSVAQDLSDYITDVNPDALNGIGQRALDAGIVGAFSGGVMTAPSGAGAGYAKVRKARQTQLNQEFYLALGKTAESMKLRERLPEAKRQLVEQITQGSGVENVYIPVEAFDEYFQKKGVDVVAVSGELGILTQYEESKETGSPLEIPLGLWAEKVVGTEHYQGLANDIKFHPEELTANEQKVVDEEAKAELQKAQEEAESQGQEKKADTSGEVEARFREQLTQAGETPEMATVFAERARARAERRGKGEDPLSLFQSREIEIRQADASEAVDANEVAQSFEQPIDPKILQEENEHLESPEGKGDRFFPRLNASELERLGAEDKPVVVKENIAKKNRVRHPEIPKGESAKVLREALYSPTHILQSKPTTKPNYWTFIKKNGNAKISVIEINGEKSNHEVVHWYQIDEKEFNRRVRKAEREGGQFLITERASSQGAADLSALPSGKPSINDSGEGSNEGGGTQYFQGATEQARGRIRFLSTKAIIDLFQHKNKSTLIHESGHLWLEELIEDATTPGVPEQLSRDLDTILEWFGVGARARDGMEAVKAAIQTEHHEQFARGIEAYFMEGRAPSQKLRKLFAKFKVWLTSVYRSIRNLNVPLSDDVRGVMDRLLATDEEIAAMERERNMKPLVNEAKALGLTEEQFLEYQSMMDEARLAAKEKLDAKLMADFEREKSEFIEQKKEIIRESITMQLEKLPVYRALDALRNGLKSADGSILEGKDFKLSKSSLLTAYDKDFIKALPKKIVSAKGGIDFNIAADLLGFQTGDEMMQALTKVEEIDVVVEREVEAEIQDKYPGLLQQGLSQAALESIHNDSRAKLLRMELEFLAKHNLPGLKKVMRKVARRVPTEKAVREQAQALIGGKKVREIKPYVFERAEVKAANEAARLLTQGDIEGAFEAKRRELLNHELYRAAVAAQEMVEKRLEFYKRLAKKDEALAKSRDVDLVNAARAILSQFGIGKAERTAAQYLEQVRLYDPETHATLEALIQSGTERAGPYKEVSYDDFVAMDDTVSAIWELSKSVRQMEIDGVMRDREEVKEELTVRLEEVSKPGNRAGYDRAATEWDKTKVQLLGARASGRRVEHWAEAIDGGRGVFTRYIVEPVLEAANRYRIAKREVLEKYLNDIVKPIEKSIDQKPIQAPELGYTFGGKRELLGALLHTGNDSNFDKLLMGRGWGALDAEGMVYRGRWNQFIARLHREGVLTKADWDFVQGVWDLMDSIKPEAQRAHKRMYGYYFNEVTAQEVVTPFGVYRGGYFPAVTDPFLVQDQELHREREALEQGGNSFMFPTTGRGFTKSRVENYRAALSLDLSLVPMHIDKVLRFVHIEPAVKDAARIVTDRGVRAKLNEFDPGVASDMLTPWLQRTAQQKVTGQMQGKGGKFVDRVAKAIRTRAGLNVMFAGVTNAMQQLTGVSVAAVKVKPRHLRNALWAYVKAPQATAEMISEKSEMMQTRLGSSAQEIQMHIDDILLNPSKYEELRAFTQKHGYFLQTGTQNVVDQVVWIGAYEQAIEEGGSEKDAVRAADAAVRQTQGSMNPEDVSRLETGAPFFRLFTMFYSYFNMLANLYGTEFVKVQRDLGLKKGMGRLLYVYVFGFAIPAFLSELIVKAMAGGIDEDDDDEYLDDLMSMFFGSQYRTATALVPAVGPLVNAAVNRFNDKQYDDRISTSPAISMLESTTSAPYSVYKAVEGEGSKKRAIRDTLTAVGMLSGVPVAPLGKPLGYLADVSEGKAEPTGPVDFARGLVTGKAGGPNR